MTLLSSKFFVMDGQAISSKLSVTTGSLSAPWKAVFETFSRNLLSVVHTGELPFRLVCNSAARLRFQRLCFLEQENLGRKTAALTAADVPFIRARALERLNTDRQTPALMLKDAQWTEDELSKEQAASPEYRYAHDDLLRQCLVMTWNALEVLARDGFVALITRNPLHLATLCRTDFARSRIGARRSEAIVGGETFDAEWIVDRLNFNNLVTLRTCFTETLDQSRTGKMSELASPLLDNLYHRRHLIVHRRGVVDATYIGATKDHRSIGEELVISPGELTAAILMIEACGASIMRACAASD